MRIDLSSQRRGSVSRAHGGLSPGQHAPLLDNNYRFNVAPEQTDRINHNELEFDDGVRAVCRCRLTEQVSEKNHALRKGFVQRVNLCKFANPRAFWGHIKVIYRLTICMETES